MPTEQTRCHQENLNPSLKPHRSHISAERATMMLRQAVNMSAQAVHPVIALTVFNVMLEHRANPVDLFSAERVGKKRPLLAQNHVELVLIRRAPLVSNVLASLLACAQIHFFVETPSMKHPSHAKKPVLQVWTQSAQEELLVTNTQHVHRTESPHLLRRTIGQKVLSFVVLTTMTHQLNVRPHVQVDHLSSVRLAMHVLQVHLALPHPTMIRTTSMTKMTSRWKSKSLKTS